MQDVGAGSPRPLVKVPSVQFLRYPGDPPLTDCMQAFTDQKLFSGMQTALMHSRANELDYRFCGLARLYPIFGVKDVMGVPIVAVIVKLTPVA